MFHSCFTRSQATTSRWVLPHIYWDWWNSDNDKNKQMNNNLNINAVEIVKKKQKKTGCFHLRAMHTFLIILPSSNILVKLPNLLTCGDKALTSPTKHWYSTVPPIAWLPSFVGLHNGTKLQFFSKSILTEWNFFSQWHLVVCYHHSETDPNLKPIFCVQSSTKSVEAMHSLMMIIS